MLAAHYLEPRRFELRDVPRPLPGAGEVVVKVRACGICGSDLHVFHGGLPAPAVCPGHEIGAEVVDIGAGVDGIAEGDRVAVEPLITCRQCAACRVGDYQICRNFQLLGTSADGGFAEFVRIPAYTLFRLPDRLDWVLGALVEPTAVCVHGVRLANIRLGDRVLVIGAGTIGLLSALAARAAGAGEVVITARHPHQAEAARRLGARPFGDADSEALTAYAFDNPIDAVIETVGGAADTLNQALLCVRPGGTVATLGIFTGMASINALFLVLKEARIVGSLTYGRAGGRADFEVAMQLLADHREAVEPLVTHRFPLRRIQEAFDTASDKAKRSIKVTLEA